MKLLISLSLILWNLSVFSQEWHSYYSDDKIDIQVMMYDTLDVVHNHNHQRVIFKYINNSNSDVSIRFDRPIAYDGVDLPASSERQFTIFIPAESEVRYNNENKSDKRFYIFSKDHNDMIKRNLTAFDIQNLTYLQL
jgi:hypothetical protein